jgi:hypothetical protein
VNWIELAVLLFAGAFFLFGLATVLYVSWRYAIMALSMDAALLREFKGTPLQAPQQTATSVGSANYQTYGKPAKTDGGFFTMTDEQAYEQEQMEQAKSTFGPHATEQDLIDYLRQRAVGAETDKET